MENIQQLINDYKEIGSLEKVALKNNVGKKKAKKLLLENNIELNQKGGQVKFNVQKFPKIQPQNPENKIVAICKQTGKQFNDPNDRSGAIKKYIEQELQIQYPSLNERRKYYSINKSYWFEQYFIIKEIPKETTRKCKKCGWETKDIHNKTGAFEVHIKNHHDEYNSIEDYLNEFPEDRIYHSKYFKNKKRKKDFKKEGYVTCRECNKKFKKITTKHLINKHGMNEEQYKLKHPDAKIVNKKESKRLSEHQKYLNKIIDPVHTSQPEYDISEFLEKNNIKTILNDKNVLNGTEIDIFIPDYNMGIEFNGNKWHTEKYKSSRYFHVNKTELALKKNIELIHIFEDEWFMKRNIIIDKLLHIFNLKNNKIYARNTKLQIIDHEIKNEFLNNNHIQGYDKSTISIGAVYNQELIGVMTFTQTNYDGIFNLSRFATKSGLICPGLASKLLNYFINNIKPNKIITFADRKWSPKSGSTLYEKLGFSLKNTLKPSYSYYNPKIHKYKRYHKFAFRKQHLIRQYGFNSSMTEREMTEALGYERIWDCGLLKYEMNFN